MSQQTNTFGPFNRGSFAGATVVNFTASAGWKEQSSFLNIIVVEDPVNGDDFLLKDDNQQMLGGQYIGTPFSFVYEGFRFDGLLKAVEQVNDFNTNPSWQVTLATPIEILDATQVILGNYVGPINNSIFSSDIQPSATFQVSNLLNVFGWAENGGADFGRSQYTDIGMPWDGTYGIYNGLTILSNTPPPSDPTTNYGSYLNYRNQYYKLDLSNFPTPPTYYYLGGVTNMSLLELLSKFFEDAGCDYIVKLTVNPNGIGPHTIGFVVIPRYIQQQLGLIYPYILEQTNLGHYSHGQELRSDITQAFLVGGSINLLQPLYNENPTNLTIMPFWGFDLQGNPIIGYKPDGTQYADDDYAMQLNGSAIADILGELGISPPMYSTNILELRCALGNYDTWAAYLKIFKPSLFQQLGVYTMFDTDGAHFGQVVIDLLNDSPSFVEQLSGMFQNSHWPAVSQRLYEWVRQQAETYYGRKFIVKLPVEIQVKIDPTTQTASFNYDIADAGFVPEGSQVLDLNYINENFFLDQTGRFYPFVQFIYANVFNSVYGQKVTLPNISYLNGTSYITQYNQDASNAYIFARCEQGESAPIYQNGMIGGSPIFFVSNGFLTVPAMVVEIADPIWAQAEDISGSTTDIAAMLNMATDNLRNMLLARMTSFPMVIHPPAYYPDAVAVALKSNQFVYGPWGKFGTNGKIEFEQDQGLVPWEYGGYDIMTQAAEAKIATIAMGNQVLERGFIYQAGIPQASLGDTLIQDGPILTNVKCSISTQSVSTEYSMETFVNRAGSFIIENAERLKRIGKMYQQLRRTIRQVIIEQLKQSMIFQQNYKGFMFGTSYTVEQRTPQGCLGGSLYFGNDNKYRPFAWSQTFHESLSNLGGITGDRFQSTACVSMDFLLRPYTTDINSQYLPVFTEPDPNYSFKDYTNLFHLQAITSSGSLNPLQSGCDIQWLVSGTGYQGLRQSSTPADFNTARAMALRGPLVICGWGYDIAGNPFPNSGAIQGDLVNLWPSLNQMTNQFLPNYLTDSVNWPVGSLDVAWDKWRGVWASRGMTLCGSASGDIPPGATGYVNLWIAGKVSNEFLPVQNFFNQITVKDGMKIMVGYDPMNGYWRPITFDCSS